MPGSSATTQTATPPGKAGFPAGHTAGDAGPASRTRRTTSSAAWPARRPGWPCSRSRRRAEMSRPPVLRRWAHARPRSRRWLLSLFLVGRSQGSARRGGSNRLRQVGDRGPFEEASEREVHLESLAQPCSELGGQKRTSAEIVEEVVENTDIADA